MQLGKVQKIILFSPDNKNFASHYNNEHEELNKSPAKYFTDIHHPTRSCN